MYGACRAVVKRVVRPSSPSGSPAARHRGDRGRRAPQPPGGRRHDDSARLTGPAANDDQHEAVEGLALVRRERNEAGGIAVVGRDDLAGPLDREPDPVLRPRLRSLPTPRRRPRVARLRIPSWCAKRCRCRSADGKQRRVFVDSRALQPSSEQLFGSRRETTSGFFSTRMKTSLNSSRTSPLVAVGKNAPNHPG